MTGLSHNSSRRLLPVIGALAFLSGCASEPQKLYGGPTQPAQNTATIVSHRGFDLHVDGLHLLDSASVLPGRHRIVVSDYIVSGYVELDAKAGRLYTARTMPVKDGVRSWAVDLETCTVVAGVPPENFSTMKPTERGCAEEEMSSEETAAAAIATAVVAVPLLLGVLFVTGGQIPVIPTDPEECADRCYTGPDPGEELTATLLVPAWFRQEEENCGVSFFTVLPSRFRCLKKLHIDGLRVAKNERKVLLSVGRHGVVLTAFANTDVWGSQFQRTDGLYLEAEADRVYALCVSLDDDELIFKIWVVNNEMGHVVAGQKWDFDAETVSSYSRFCPIN